nr:hypothetical protein [Tanacetum cinerariifolium]
IPATSSEGTGTKPGVPDEKKITSKANVILEWGSKQEINDDEDEDTTNVEIEESGNGDEEITDAAKADAGKTEEVKVDAKKAELPLTSSSLSSLPILTVPVLVFSEPSVLTPIPETPTMAPVTTLLPHPSASTIPPVLLKKTTPIRAPLITTKVPTIITTVSKFDALTAVQLRVVKLEKDPALEPSKIQTSRINLEQESKKSALEIYKIKKEQAKKKNMLKYTIKSPDKAALKEFDRGLNDMDKGVADKVKNHKRQHDDNEDEDEDTSEPNEEPIAEVEIDNQQTTANEDVVNDVDRPQDCVAPKTNKPSKDTLFKQPPRLPTPDPCGKLEVRGGGGTLGEGDIEDKEVAIVDGVFEGAFGVLSDKTCFSGCHGGLWWLIMDEEDDETSRINLEQESKKSALEIYKIKKEQAKKKNMLKYTIKSPDKAALKEFDRGLNDMDKGVADKVKNHKRQHDDNEDEDEDTSEPNEEPIAEVEIDNQQTTANEDVVNDVDRPQDCVAPKTNKPSKDTLFKQPPRLPTPDPCGKLEVRGGGGTLGEGDIGLKFEALVDAMEVYGG